MTIPFTLNGRFLTQSVTGVQRVAREALVEFDRLAAVGAISPPRLLVPAKGKLVMPPDLLAIKIERSGRFTGHAWEQIELPKLAGHEPLLCLGNTAPIIRLHQSNRPVIVMVHDLSYKYFPRAYSWKFKSLYGAMMPAILRLADKVVTVSAAEQIMIAKHYPKLMNNPKFSYLQNGGILDSVALRAKLETPKSRKDRSYGIYVGSLTHRKNAEGILRAAVAFLKRYKEMRFVIVGATSDSFESVNIDVPSGVESRLEFMGQINDAAKIHDLYRSARFLLFPSFYEASPLPPIEAMTFGCPVVSSKIPSLIERCGDAAIYCDPSDPTSISEAITQLMDDDNTWESFAQKARIRAEHYSWASQALGLIELCESVR